MANKFQKSVLERLEHEVDLQKQKTKILKNKKAQVDSNQPATVEAKDITDDGKVTAKIPQENIISQDKISDEMPDIGRYIRKGITRLAKNKTFYLDSDVVDAVKSTAKRQAVTDSKLVNDILRGVLRLD